MSEGKKVRRLPDERGDPAPVVAMAFAAVGLFALTASYRCSDTQYVPPDRVLPGHFCKSTGFYPGSFGNTVLVCLTSLLPAALATVGLLGTRATGKRWLQWAAFLLGSAFLYAEYVLSRHAHLGFLPTGP